MCWFIGLFFLHVVFFFNDTATTEIYTLSLHDALPIYCVLAGNEQPLTEIGIVGMKEMYQSLGIPLANWVEALRCIKEEAQELLGNQDAALVTPYFDKIIQALALPGTPYLINDGNSDW